LRHRILKPRFQAGVAGQCPSSHLAITIGSLSGRRSRGFRLEFRVQKPGARFARRYGLSFKKQTGERMTFGQSISSCYSNFATFSGRAARSEYWFFTLFHFLAIMMCIVLVPLGIGIVAIWVVSIGNFLPALSVLVRRLHDTNHSGWWYWFLLVPIVGVIVLFIWFCSRGTDGPNDYGADPLSRDGFSPRPPSGNIAEELRKLAKLRDEGTISDEEFQRLKTKLI
jgi:uncharacterized membrane protein YhaH (DUF805 family)